MYLAEVVSALTICGLGITLNSCEIASLIRARRTKLPFDVTLISFAISDLLLSFLTIMLYSIGYSLPNVKTRKLYVNFDIICFHLPAVASSLHMWFIAFQRLIAVLYPLEVSIWITRKRSFITLLLIWLVSTAVSAPLLLDNYTYQRVFICNPFISTAVIIICYFIISHKMLTRKAPTVEGQQAQNISVLVYSISISAIYTVTIFPLAIDAIRQPVLLRKMIFQACFGHIFYLQVVLDPVVYFFSQILKRNSFRTCSLLCHCCRSEDVSIN